MENKEKLKIGVVFGGLSAECEVSLATGRYIYSLLDQQNYTGTPFYLDKSGQLWQLPDKLVIQNTTADVDRRLATDAARVHFEELPKKVDCIFNALLGKYGEDGCFQGVLELLQIPYTGSGILASALGMDKKVHKKMLAGAGFLVARDILVQSEIPASPVIDSEAQTRRAGGENLKLKIKNYFGYPCVVKPTREGSSMGVSVVKEEKGLEAALAYAFKYDREVLVEEYLKGMEFTCVVWGNEEPKAMLPTEIVFAGDFFTYEGKYMPGKTQTITPARLSEVVIAEIQRQAVEIYELIGCKGYGRVDGFVVPKTKRAEEPGSLRSLSLSEVSIYIAEPHTGTIMVPSSFVFQQAAKFRIDLSTEFHGKKGSIPMTPRILVTKIIELALSAHRNKKGLL